MKLKHKFSFLMIWALVLLMAVPPGVFAQDAAANPAFKQGELDQMLAPIALYPDSLLTQVLMASTYPLEIVQADRWAKKNKDMKGDALAKALEAQPWDPSVKSLVNFPQVLAMMSDKLDWTQTLGDAFLAQQKDVMDTVQNLRAKAQATGNLKTTSQQVVTSEKNVIIIQPASPQVIYVPAYNPTVVYGAWAYPAYPPYYYYPPGYVAGAAAFSFAAGVAVSAAWGYAWGSPNWRGGNVNVNVNQNTSINTNINRSNYATQYQGKGQGQWQHDASHRGGVSYNNPAVAQKYNQMAPNQKVQAREAYRGYTGSALTPKEQQQAQQRAQQAQQQQRTSQAQKRGGTSQGGGAFEGMDRGGSATREASSRGSISRQSMSREGGGFGGGGGARGGGGGRGGGRR